MTRSSPFNVLFLCTGNSARSILAESILRKEGGGNFVAFSAGSNPKPDIHPMSLQVLQEFEFPTTNLRSKSWNEFANPEAPKMDFVFTVCDTAAGESCPVWPGQPVTGHWGIEDPAKVEGEDIWKRAAFSKAFKYLRNRITAFVSLPLESLERTALNARIREIGAMEGSAVAADEKRRDAGERRHS